MARRTVSRAAGPVTVVRPAETRWQDALTLAGLFPEERVVIEYEGAYHFDRSRSRSLATTAPVSGRGRLAGHPAQLWDLDAVVARVRREH